MGEQSEHQKLRSEYGWAIELVRREFQRGLEEICANDFLKARYREFELKHDPIYAELLSSMEDRPLAETFVSYWMIAQTLATRSRFWLEFSIAEMLIHQARETRNLGRCVYSQAMLSNGWLNRQVSVAEMGEERREHMTDRRPWRVRVQSSALQVIDLLVGEQERERVERKRAEPQLSFVRDWQRQASPQIAAKDRRQLAKIAHSFQGPPVQEVTLQCNLLVIEPSRMDAQPHAWAVRFINPKTISSHAARKQERVNLLRLYAFLVQEKILRDPKQIEVCVAELLPSYSGFEDRDRYPDYFSSETYWTTCRFWDFVGVPFEVVTCAIQDVAKEFRDRLRSGLRGLLPREQQTGS